MKYANLNNFKEALEPLGELIKKIHEKDSPWETLDTEGLKGSLDGYCPVQGKGYVDGLPWYFRARWDEWSFSISEDKDTDPIDVRWNKASGWYYEGFYNNASWMEYKDAQEVIKDCVQKFRAGEGYYKSEQ